jgi:hypothetical protein
VAEEDSALRNLAVYAVEDGTPGAQRI